MRELKFRAWVYYGERLRKPRYSDDDWLCRFFEDCKEDDTDENGKPQCIEQYTGLKDKNGKEIYDGDIIQETLGFDVDSIDGTFKYKVFWNEDMLCWSLEYIGNESIHDDLYECNSTVEVIGNIHENPELFDKEK